MGKIICLMGKSSSGKDTVFKRLLEQEKFPLRRIVSYTTRPIRDGEREGVEYHFTNEAEYEALQKQGRVIETRIYHTCHGEWRYFTVADDSLDLSHYSYLMIGTLEAYEQICAYYGKDKITPVMLTLDDGLRLQRALDRERAQDNPGYDELCRRFLADGEDFAPEKLRQAGIDRTFCNEDLENCLEEILVFLQADSEQE